MKTTISITKEQGTGIQPIANISTSSFILLYLKDDKVKVEGDIELRDLAPMLLKLAASKFARE